MIRDKLREQHERYSIQKAFLLDTNIRLYRTFSGNVGVDVYIYFFLSRPKNEEGER